MKAPDAVNLFQSFNKLIIVVSLVNFSVCPLLHPALHIIVVGSSVGYLCQVSLISCAVN